MSLGASPGSPLPLAARRLGGVLWPPQSPAQPGTVWHGPATAFLCALLCMYLNSPVEQGLP